MENVPGKVYAAINKVQLDLSHDGITKNRQNQQQGYKFRGIDDVYNAVSPLLAKHGLCILPRMLSRAVVEKATKAGGALFYVTVEAEFDFVAAEDGSRHIVKTYGEAMDSGDKATNKAMSAAYKYAIMQAFAIPTEGDNDADAQTQPPIAPANTTGRPRNAPPANNAPPAKRELSEEMTAFYAQFEEAALARGVVQNGRVAVDWLEKTLKARKIDTFNVPAAKRTEILSKLADGDFDKFFKAPPAKQAA